MPTRTTSDALTSRPSNSSSVSTAGSAISSALTKRALSAIDADRARLEGIYKDIHQHPELAFMEVRTSEIVAKELKSLGFEVITGIAKTGVVGVLRNGAGPTVMYRADMDANGVEELSGLPYASKVRVRRDDDTEVPVAHMCGHDAHITWMLGLAKAMVSLKSEWSGTLVLVAQPAEETITGAEAMIDDGFYTKYGIPKPDSFIALHTAPVATGLVGVRGGTIMAGSDQIDVTFHGIGGHGSMPQLSKDPVIMAAAAVMQYQMIISRVVNPLDASVLTVGSIQAGTDNNVIPDSALLKINLRFFDMKVREQMIDGIRSINEGIARAYGLPEDKMPTMVMKGHSPPLVNSDELTDRLAVPLRGLLGERNVITEFPPATGSEDAHVLVSQVADAKVAYMAVGIAEPKVFEQARREGKMMPFSAHSPHFRVDLDAIPLGAKVGLLSVLEVLAKSGSKSVVH